jgi:hypothetical protein
MPLCSCAAQQPATRPAASPAAQAASPAQAAHAGQATSKLPHIQVDVAARQVRVECEAIELDAPLEFVCVARGGNEHEAMLRTDARPSHVHLALLMLGLEPGTPLRYMDAAQRWVPPSGPPLMVSLEFEREGKQVRVPVSRVLRHVVNEDDPRPQNSIKNWVFTGSQIQEGGGYAADVTGYIVSLVNFELTPIDIGALASSSNELLEWERDPATAPLPGSKVTMILEPVGKPGGTEAAIRSSDAPRPAPTTRASVRLDQAKVDALQQRWKQSVALGAGPLRKAAEAHYEIVRELQQEQQRLISEADRVARVIDELQRGYNELTTPRPAQKD